jgi:hypothetical protein
MATPTRAEQFARRHYGLICAQFEQLGHRVVCWDELDPGRQQVMIDVAEQVLPPAVEHPTTWSLRRFTLRRDADETGMSGTGDVAAGVVFPDGTAAMRWCTDVASTSVYASIEDVVQIHGHGGRTRVVFTD